MLLAPPVHVLIKVPPTYILMSEPSTSTLPIVLPSPCVQKLEVLPDLELIEPQSVSPFPLLWNQIWYPLNGWL